jgi:hypothetical protein
MVQSDITITKARTSPNDNSGTVGVGEAVVDVVNASVGAADSVGDEMAELDVGKRVGGEFGEAKFTNALSESFGFPLLSKRPKLELGLSV